MSRWLDAELDRVFLWAPVAFGVGIAAYFQLATEPSLVAAAAPLVVALVAWGMAGRASVARIAAIGAVLTALGFFTAKVRVETVRAPVISKTLYRANLSGTIIKAEPRGGRGQRLTLALDHLEGFAAPDRPAVVRIRTLKKDERRFAVGERVAVSARLSPPSGPVLPGAFDFARTAWFERIGAVGYTFQPVQLLPALEPPSFWLRSHAAIQALRSDINARVNAVLPGERGAMASALMTGERGGISEETNDAYRSSGLFHILSISGLHMVVMAGTVFMLVRSLLAAVPAIALRWPIKKIAAVAGIGAAFGYLAISGVAFATVRAALMITVAFTAILFDRPALTLRNVALSALIILMIYPESLFDAGFQMSFAAVTALVAVYEEFRRRRMPARLRQGVAARTARFFGGIVATTLIASVAVAPFAAFHFHQSQQLSVIANMMAIPICNIIVMPAALASFILMPFGLEWMSLPVLGAGISAMTWCATFVAGLPGAVSRLPAFSTLAFGLIVFGGLWCLLWRTRLRLAGVAAIATGLALAPLTERPDMLIGRDGQLVALRDEDGRLQALPAPRTKFELDRWLKHDGDERSVRQASSGTAFTCDAIGCVARRDGLEILIPKHPAAFRDDCQPSRNLTRIVVLSVPRPAGCGAGVRVVDLFDVWRDGTHAFYFTPVRRPDGDGTSTSTSTSMSGEGGRTTDAAVVDIARVDTVRAARGHRPWAPVWRSGARLRDVSGREAAGRGVAGRGVETRRAGDGGGAAGIAGPSAGMGSGRTVTPPTAPVTVDPMDDDISDAEDDINDAVR